MPNNKLKKRGLALRFLFFLSILFALTSCGAVIRLDNLEISLPTRVPSTELSPTVAPTATITPSPTATASPTVVSTPTITTKVNLNLRAAATINSSVYLVIPANTRITLFGRSADSAWLGVQYGSLRGWVSSADNLVQINGASLASLPIISQLPPASSTPNDPTPTREGSAKTRIGYNTNGEAVPDMAYFLGVVSNPCGTLQLVMNNLALAVEIKERCPDTIVVSRNYNPQEGDEWVLSSPESRVAIWKAEGHFEIVRHSTNEPSFGRGRRLEEFVAKECELMRLARLAGITMAMGNFSVGIFEPQDINAGFFDPYLRCLEIYGHYLALHEYAVAVLSMGVGQWQTSFLLDRNRVQPASWPLAAALPTCWASGLSPYWYLMRGTWFLCRADTIGVARPRILVTEFGWDNLPNIKPEIEPLRLQFGLPQYMNDMRGVNTYSRLWAWYWPQWSFAQAACEQLIWADSVYPPEYLGFALFTWSWYRGSFWLQTDFSGRENGAHYELHQCLEDYSNSPN